MAATLNTEDNKQRTTHVEDRHENQLSRSPEHGFNSIPPNHALSSSSQADQSLSSASTCCKPPFPDELLLHLADFLHAKDVLSLSLTCKEYSRLFENDRKSLRVGLEPRRHVTSETDSTKREERKLPLWVRSFLLEKQYVGNSFARRAYVMCRQAEYYRSTISACFEIMENNDLDENKKREKLKRTVPHVRLLFLEQVFQKYRHGSRERAFIEDCIVKGIFGEVPWDHLLWAELTQIQFSLPNITLSTSEDEKYARAISECGCRSEINFLIGQGANPRIRTDYISHLQEARRKKRYQDSINKRLRLIAMNRRAQRTQ